MRLGIDLDGVVADFNAGWIGFYNEEFGTDVPFDAVDSWDAIPGLTHFPSMGAFWRWAENLNGATLFRHLDTYPGAVDALWRLAKRGHDIVILTTKPYWAVHDTYAWISEQMLPTTEVHILDDKWTVDCDVYLDDAPHQVYRIRRQRPDRAVVRFVRPWNHPVPGTHEIRDWDEFEELVDRLDRSDHLHPGEHLGDTPA